jgi:hypothetical protein
MGKRQQNDQINRTRGAQNSRDKPNAKIAEEENVAENNDVGVC